MRLLICWSRLRADSKCVDAIERVDVPGFGQHLVIRAFQKQSDAKQILLVGHTDTVHARGSVSERPWRRESGQDLWSGHLRHESELRTRD